MRLVVELLFSQLTCCRVVSAIHSHKTGVEEHFEFPQEAEVTV